jgi:hypothetical protein
MIKRHLPLSDKLYKKMALELENLLTVNGITL